MTTTTPQAAKQDTAPPPVSFLIDDVELSVPKGTLVIRAAEQIGIQIPRFCDHPLLAPAGACRQCLVEVSVPDREGNVRPMPKPQASCTLEATPGMVVRTQLTSAVADKAQHGVMELLLINHPLDCPTCDKGGECPLQNQSMSNGYGSSRYHDVKRTFAKPLRISTQILLDRERCILCQRCTRFSDEIAGDAFIDLQERGIRQQIGTFDPTVLGFEGAGAVEVFHGAQPDGSHAPASSAPLGPVGEATTDTSGRAFSSYFSGNTVQICPVGALTGAAYRFRSRPFDLVSTPGIAEHDSNGAAIRVDHRRGVVLRRLAGDDPAVNEEWISDKDRFAFTWQSAGDRIATPMVRDVVDGRPGELRTASWSEAITRAADGLAAAKATGVGVLPGGRLTLEDAYAYAKFARVSLGTNDVDHRARPHSAEEEAFLAHAVAGRPLDVTFADLEAGPAVLLVGYEPEDEGGIAFLRLRKGVQAGRSRVFSVAPFASRGLTRLDATLLSAAPGTEPEVLDAVVAGAEGDLGAAAEALRGGVVLVGERMATVVGGLSAALRLAARLGARLAWVPRRIGERAGVEAGLLPGLLPGGRLVIDAGARVDLAAAWNVDRLPSAAGRSLDQMLVAATKGRLGALVVGGLDPADLSDPSLALRALEAVPFLVSLEVRASAVTALADVVLPVAPPSEKSGTYLGWEGRPRPFPQALTSTAMSDHKVLDVLAAALGAPLGLRTLAEVHAELTQVGPWDGPRTAAPHIVYPEPPALRARQAVLASWHLLLDDARGQDGERFLAGTAQRPVARVGAELAARIGVRTGDEVTVATGHGSITLPVVLTPMPDGVVWLPTHSPGSHVRSSLRADAGAVVTVTAARPAAVAEGGTK